MELSDKKELTLWMRENGAESFIIPGEIAVTFRDNETDRTSGFIPDHLVITDEEDMFNVQR
tara:strand:- start:122 stop:304 length:183 start_codon:yes stop_codon:yes gene_type:complete